MKRSWGGALLAGASVWASAWAGNASWRCDFSNTAEFAKNWRFEGSKMFVPKTEFFITRSPGATNGMALAVKADRATGLVVTAPEKVDLQKTPIMRWRWRVVKPVILKNEHRNRTIEPDDQAAVIYFGDGTTFQQKSIAYRWEVGTPLEHVGKCSYLGGVMTVNYRCIRNDRTPPNEWVVESRDVLEDFRKAYRMNPAQRFILSIGANSQYTKSDTHAEIDYIEFVPRETEKKK